MAKRFFPIFSIMLLLISLVAPGIQPVAAEEKEDKVYEDGTYNVPLRILDANEDKDSTMQGFLKNNTPSVEVTDGRANVTVTFTQASMIKDFEVDKQKAEIVEENEKDDERTYSFIINDLDEIAQGKVAVEVPGVYDTTHDIRLQFDTSEIPVVEDEPDNGEEPSDNEGSEDGAESEGNEGSEDEDESEGNEDTEDGAESEENEDIEDGAESEDNEDTEEGAESEDNENTEDDAESEDN